MTENPLRSAQMHRFRDTVAFYCSGPDFKRGKYPATVYLAPGEARAIAAALLACATDCEARGFADSQFRTVEVASGADAPADALRDAAPATRDALALAWGMLPAIDPAHPHMAAYDAIRAALALAGGDATAVSAAPDWRAIAAALLPYAELHTDWLQGCVPGGVAEVNDASAAVDAAKAALAGDTVEHAPGRADAIAALESAEAFLIDCPATAHRDAVLRDVRAALVGDTVAAMSAPQDATDAAGITPPTTDDMGAYVRDMLGEGYIDSEAGARGRERDSIEHVDADDASNLRLTMASGARFVVRIVREG